MKNAASFLLVRNFANCCMGGNDNSITPIPQQSEMGHWMLS
jgi:hypothetical protein